jgi:hypothetical protein
MGMQMFATTRKGPMLDTIADFSTFGASLQTLFLCVAGENYLQIMADVSIKAPYCTPQWGGAGEKSPYWMSGTDCGNSVMAILFFYSFFIIVFCVFLPLYLATILDTYSSKSVDTSNNDAISLTREDVDKFSRVWAIFDPYATGRIELGQLETFVSTLEKESNLGFDTEANPKLLRSLVEQLTWNSADEFGAQDRHAAPKRRRQSTLMKIGRRFSSAVLGKPMVVAPTSDAPVKMFVRFYELLKMLAMQGVHESCLDITEREMRAQNEGLIRTSLAAKSIQRMLRTFLWRRNLKYLREIKELANSSSRRSV